MKSTYYAVIASALCGLGCDAAVSGSSNIEYRASASTRVSVTYAASGGATQQANDTASPWSYSFSAKKGDFLYVSAQQGDTSGCVLVRIIKGGEDLESSQSCGRFAIATASTTLE